MAFHLSGLRFEPNRALSAMVERALYPAYRDACLEAGRITTKCRG
jgi:hypothetical protein